jgi:hypothetical protein
VVHHTGKDATRGGRGHSSLFGAVDVELTVAPEMRDDPDDEGKRYPRQIETGRRYIEGTKMRDGIKMDRCYFELHQITLPADEDGDPVTSCVVRGL